jgi:alginate O-acetyltransferase complex protein AlgI
MRPFRSFLFLLVFLVSLTWIFNIFHVKDFFKITPEPVTITTPVARDTIPVISVPDSTDLLSSFLDTLDRSHGQTRILYYGDSQVEGDRITFYLRQLLRKGRAGTGPGLFQPVMLVMYTKTLWLRSSSNWQRYNYLSFKSGEISHNKLGPFMAVCRYLPEGVKADVPQKATVSIRTSNFADSAVSSWEMLRIFYSLQGGTVKIVVKGDDKQVVADTLSTLPGVHEFSRDITGTKELEIEFEGRVSPNIYGMSIESRTGVIVDNIPQRGSAGLEFTMVDGGNLKDTYTMLAPDLIILHYGLNIVKNVRTGYSYYQRGLFRQIMAIKEASPGTPVLVIGVTDMASNAGDSAKSYTNIPAIIKAQRDAAREAGAAFWDSYEAMGGGNSIINWAGRKIPLAQKDLVHFTYPGADTLALLLEKSLFISKHALVDTTGGAVSVPVTVPVSTNADTNAIQAEDRETLSIQAILKQIFSYDPDRPFIFSAPAFWLFLLVVIAGYSLIYKKLFLRNFYLLIASLFFYYKTGGLFLFLLVFVTVIDFTCGYLIYRSEKKIIKRLFILFSLISNLGILAYFKYTGFIIGTINELAGTHMVVTDFLASFSNSFMGTHFDISSIILPAGISFFTFQSLSYTIDIYRGKLKPVRNIIDFGFYVSFFPQLVAGPIVRASEFIPQLYAPYNLGKREFSHALFMISKGLIKKIVISDFIAVNFIDRVFDLPSMYSGFENLMAIYGYGLQIYCDFSGYTDIALGVALVLGFRLPVNFNSPYKSASIADFWRRWHISLSRWLKDYLYISLGGNRKSKFRTGVNLMITMLLGGLWHGASMRFVIWGGLHGIGLIINKIWDSITGKRFGTGPVWKIIAVFITFNFVNFCWIFFRSPDMQSAILMIRQIGENFSPGSYRTVIPAYSGVFLLIAAGYIIHFLPENIKEGYRGLFIKMPLILQLIIVMLVAVVLLEMRSTDIMPFIYFRF